MFKYMANTVPVSIEFGVVAIGPIANLGIFGIFVIMSIMFYRVITLLLFYFFN